MAVPSKFSHIYVSVKYFLTAYRALSDGKIGLIHLEEHLRSSRFRLSDWKVIWIGTCTLLRTSIDLFQVDAKSCLSKRIREEILIEWASIKEKRDEHPIFWEFLRKERDNIIHEYEWAAYEAWMEQDGTVRPARISLLDVKPQDVRSVLIMRAGQYKSRNSLELLQESAEWVESRIFGAIRRAGFEPDEARNLVSFEKRPTE